MTDTEEIRNEELEREFERFCIDSDEKVEWLLRKITEIDASYERVKANAEALLRAYKRDREWLLRRFGVELEDYCRKKLGENPRSKTVRFLHGSVSFRTLPGRLKLTDPGAALEHLRGNNELFERCVKVTETVRVSEYTAIAEETGELLPGLGHVGPREAVYVCGHRLGEEEEE